MNLRIDHLRLPDGWSSPGYLCTDDSGLINYAGSVAPVGEAFESVTGFGIPGMPNVHSHAFQRAMAGHGEKRGPAGGDDFWSWRKEMYAWALALSPEELEAVTAQAYVEMLEAGFTSVAEFHYLHQAPDGQAYADRNELARRVVAASAATGIDLLLLPTYYDRGGFGQPPQPQQRRFVVGGLDAFCERLVDLDDEPGLRVGLGLHSLRAVPPAEVQGLAKWWHARRPHAPIHIHVAEQTAEVDACEEALGARPVRWLLDEVGLDARWCLVHATHVDAGELRDMALAGVVAGLCPTTEANLGDGIFPFANYVADGTFGIGTDSHVVLDPREELRVLEAVARMVLRRRCIAGSTLEPSTGEALWAGAVTGGARALGEPAAGLAVGAPCNLVVLDPTDARLLGHTRETVLDAFVFSPGRRPVREVYVRGRAVVKDGQHVQRDAVAARFASTLTAVRARL